MKLHDQTPSSPAREPAAQVEFSHRAWHARQENVAQPVAPPHERFITIKEACAMVGGVSEPTLRKFIRDGDFPPPYRLSPNRIGFSLHETIAWVEAQKAAQRSAAA